MDTRHYAIYGGSFDPVHVGHVALAEHAVKECGIDKLIFMPAYVSPFKTGNNTTPGHDRAAMIESILSYNSAFALSRYELRKEGPSYTYETLTHWKGLLGGKLSFILGLDSVVEIDTWYHGEDLLKEFSFITARRPHTDFSIAQSKIEEFRSRYGADITVMLMEPVDASSTEVRRRASEGQSLEGLVLPEVEDYIIRHDLYKSR